MIDRRTPNLLASTSAKVRYSPPSSEPSPSPSAPSLSSGREAESPRGEKGGLYGDPFGDRELQSSVEPTVLLRSSLDWER
jgi:hypothetical protein